MTYRCSTRTAKLVYVWVCDPLDGTIPFSHGYPIAVFAIALVKNGEPILGVIYDSLMDRMVVGEKGKGAFLNGKPIKVAASNKIHGKALINLDCDSKLFGLRKKLLKEKDCYITTFYSAIYAGMLVAFGEFLAEVYEYSNPWDGAALKVIVEEAGGKVTDLEGKEQRYNQKTINGFVATNGLVHDEILSLISSLKL